MQGLALPNLLEPYPEVVGLFVGGCVERGTGSSFRAQAHAHVTGDHRGWVCVRSWRRVFTASGGLSQLMLHEIAHVLTLQGHTDAWRRKAREIGYRVRAQEQKRQRRRGSTIVVKDGKRTIYYDGQLVEQR